MTKQKPESAEVRKLKFKNIQAEKHPRAGMVEHIDRWGTRTWTVK